MMDRPPLPPRGSQPRLDPQGEVTPNDLRQAISDMSQAVTGELSFLRKEVLDLRLAVTDVARKVTELEKTSRKSDGDIGGLKLEVGDIADTLKRVVVPQFDRIASELDTERELRRANYVRIDDLTSRTNRLAEMAHQHNGQ